jgi:hypothetical protein
MSSICDRQAALRSNNDVHLIVTRTLRNPGTGTETRPDLHGLILGRPD